MKVIVAGGEEIELGDFEATPTIGMIDYSRRVTDAFGVTTVVKRDFARRLSVRLAIPTGAVDGVQRQLAALRATSAQWVADEAFAWLSPTGFYKDFELDLAVPPISFCTLTIEGLAESETGADDGGDPAPGGAGSTLRLVDPIDIDPAVLISSSVDQFDFPQWSALTTYAAGAKVLRLNNRRIYESAAGGNVGHDPDDAGGQWIDIGPINRWAMFDQALGTATTATGSIAVTLDVVDIDAVGLLDVVGATVRVQAPGYDVTQAAGEGAIVFLDLPLTDGAVTVTVAGTGTVSVGTLLAGRIKALGHTGEAPSAGIIDYSRKEVDDFGEPTIVQRAWAKRMATRSLIATDAIDTVANRLAAVRARPSLWIADAQLDSLTVYGFFKEWSIELGDQVSTLSLSIEGLSEAAARTGLPGIGNPNWTDVIDNDPAHPKPDDGADVTGENTALNTANVGDRPTSQVLDELDAANALTDDLAALQSQAAALVAQAEDIQAQADALQDLVAQAQADIAASVIDIEAVETSVGTIGAQVSTNTSAISSLVGSVATITTKVSAGARNLLKNSGFENGLANWTVGAGVWAVHSNARGTFAQSQSAGSPYLQSDRIDVLPSSPYTVSGDALLLASAGQAQIYIRWADATDTFISDSAVSTKAAGSDFANSSDGRVQRTATAPSGAAYARVMVNGTGIAGSPPTVAWKELKLENAAYMSRFSQEASVIQTFTALSSLDTQYASLSSTVATQGSSISSNASAITTLNTQVATLTTSLSAGSINAIKNSSFENGFTHWVVVGAWSTSGSGDRYGPYAYSNIVTTQRYIYTDPMEVVAGEAFTASADMYFDASAGTGSFYLSIYWYNGTTYLSEEPGYKTPGMGFTGDQAGRVRATGIAPTGATHARVFFVATPSSGNLNVAVRQAKFERGAVMSRWTQEASVWSQAQAISSLDGQVASLTTTVSTQGSTVSSHASSISSLTSSYGSLSTSVSTLGGQVSTLSSSFTTLDGTVNSLSSTVSTHTGQISSISSVQTSQAGTLSSLSSTVSAQGSSITTNASAISTINGQLSARYGISLEAGTDIARMTAMVGGGTSAWKFEASQFSVVSPSGGAGLFWSLDGSNRGTLRVNDGSVNTVELGWLT